MTIQELQNRIEQLRKEIASCEQQIKDAELNNLHTLYKGKILHIKDGYWHGIINVKEISTVSELKGRSISWEEGRGSIEYASNAIWDIEGDVKIISKEEALEIIKNLYLFVFNNN